MDASIVIPKTSTDARNAAIGGVIAGAIAGAALTLLMIVSALVSGHDVWMGMKGAGAPFLGSRAMEPGFDLFAVSFGWMIHLAVSIAWAVPFALLAYRLARGTMLLASAAWGLVVWVGMYYIVLPIVGMGGLAQTVPIGQAFLVNVFFGLAIGGALLSWHEEETRHPEWTHAHA